MLHIIGTPIGNLKDITLRALDALKACDFILAEDTRVTKVLCREYEITAPLRSYHSFSEKKYLDQILKDLSSGKEVGIVSDAGMPGISDPGSLLISACHEAGIPVTIYPGPSACITALVLSGLAEHPFQFRGFFPQKKQKEEVVSSLYYPGISIYYEAPHRILDTLECFPANAKLAIGRELTKKYEQHISGTQQELLTHFKEHSPRGEFVLLVTGYHQPKQDPKELVDELIEKFSIDQKTALKLASELLGIPKRDIYKLCHDLSS